MIPLNIKDFMAATLSDVRTVVIYILAVVINVYWTARIEKVNKLEKMLSH